MQNIKNMFQSFKVKKIGKHAKTRPPKSMEEILEYYISPPPFVITRATQSTESPIPGLLQNRGDDIWHSLIFVMANWEL